jgi:hypothetical protein
MYYSYRTPSKWIVSLIFLLVVACTPVSVEPHIGEEPGYPAPEQTAEITYVPLPEPTLVELAPGEFYAPTLAPAPLFTPRPTPTRRPGPTATAVPLPTPPNNPTGVIRYATLSDPPYHGVYTHFEIQVDAEARISRGPEQIQLPAELDISPFQIHPSPDGRYSVLMIASLPGGLAYVIDNVTGRTQIYFENKVGGRFFGWHPDSRQFLYWIDLDSLWLINAETGEITTLIFPQGLVQGAVISPDGQTVAYIDYNLPYSKYALWFVSTSGSDAIAVVDTGSIAFLHPGAWSPDGAQIIYRGNCSAPDEPGTGPLCIFNVRTRERRLLELPFAVAYDAPSWSPNGRTILATGLAEGEMPCDQQQRSAEPIACQFMAQSVYTFNVETGEARALARGISPVWSPDGSIVAFLSDQSGAPELWIVQADGTGLQQLTQDGQFKSPFGNLSWLRR